MNRLPQLLVLAAVFLSLGSSAAPAFAGCGTSPDGQKWIEGTLSAWRKVSSKSLKLKPAPVPWLILFDERCVYHVNSDARFMDRYEQTVAISLAKEKLTLATFPHGGKIALPEKGEVAARLISFAAPYGDGKRSFVVSALPAIWHGAEHLKEEPNVDVLARSVFIHEMTHTLHRAYYPRIDALEKKLGLPDPIDDDIVQNQFGETSEFADSIAAEIELLYRSASSPGRSSRKLLAAEALKKIEQRRTGHFKGKMAALGELEDMFLSMEGTANWAAYRFALDHGLERTEAIKLIRRGGKYWSQDMGLALFLAIDGLLPGWQKRAFGKRPATALELLSAAVR
jgi:hypothetical protein